MPVQRRYLLSQVRQDLARKMVFIAGPRQVGKTTLARSLPGASGGYLSWDVAEHRERILKRELPDSRLWIFDEVHKYRSWRNLLKGLYDGRRPGQKILVTGSARLDFYRFGGDSLQGRYHMFGCTRSRQRNSPFAHPPGLPICSNWEGFPNRSLAARRSRRDAGHMNTETGVREDVAGLERIQDLGNLELLALRLPELVASPLSINALREDLQLTRPSMVGSKCWSGSTPFLGYHPSGLRVFVR